MTDNENVPFDVPDGYQDDIGNPLEGEGVRLPFYAPYVWWQNGKNSYKQTGGAPYFGGWAMSDVDMEACANQAGGNLPLGWMSYEMTNDEGEDYTAFLIRWSYLAILGTRFRWIEETNKGQYQVLAYMAYQDTNKKPAPFAPVVLTCKATAGMFLRQAVIKFATQTAAPRKQYAKNLPISAFYATIGTFGDQLATAQVGKTTKKTVTPLALWLPEKIDEGYLKAAFIGKETAALTAGLRKDAKEWLEAWKKPAEPKEKPTAEEPEYVPDPLGQPVPPEDEMPF